MSDFGNNTDAPIFPADVCHRAARDVSVRS
jgi:hypothetical protein